MKIGRGERGFSNADYRGFNNCVNPRLKIRVICVLIFQKKSPPIFHFCPPNFTT